MFFTSRVAFSSGLLLHTFLLSWHIQNRIWHGIWSLSSDKWRTVAHLWCYSSVCSLLCGGSFIFLTRNSPCHLRQFHTLLQGCCWQILVFVYCVSSSLWPCTCPSWISASPFPPQTCYTILPNHSEFKPCPPVLTVSLSVMPSENLITILSFLSSNSLMKAYARTVPRRDLAELHFCILPLWQSTIDNLSDTLSNQLCTQSITVSSRPGCWGSLMRMPHSALLKTLVRG